MEEIWDYNFIIFIVLKLKYNKNSKSQISFVGIGGPSRRVGLWVMPWGRTKARGWSMGLLDLNRWVEDKRKE